MNNKKLKILLIDQSQITDVCETYINNNVNWLEVIGKFENNIDNTQYILNLKPDIILCNSVYPIFTNILNSKAILKLKEKTKIFILSGNSDTDAINSSYKFGITKYYIKPFDIKNYF